MSVRGAIARRQAAGVVALVVAVLVAASLGAAPALAEGPHWQVSASAMPTDLPPGGEGKVLIVASNLGDRPAQGASVPVTVTDRLPAGLTATAISTETSSGGGNEEEDMTCSLNFTPSCTLARPIAPYEDLQIIIKVKVEEPQGAVTSLPNEVRVEGGEAPSAIVRQSLTVTGAPAPFGIEQYELRPENDDGSLDTQAGSHPFQLTTTLGLNTSSQSGVVVPAALPKDLYVNLPPGLIGNPNAVPQCSLADFLTIVNKTNQCQADSAVGVVDVTLMGVSQLGGPRPATLEEPLFSLSPRPGEPARFGFLAFTVPVVLDTSVRAGSDYGVTVSSQHILETAGLISSRVTVWGVPGDPRHDASRGWACLKPVLGLGMSCVPGGQSHPAAFLSLPTSCTSPLESSVEGDSWPAPGKPSEVAEPLRFTLHDSSGSSLALDGCSALPFSPTLSMAPETRAASTPAGLRTDLRVPQESTLTDSELAEADVKDTTVTLPEGMQLNPSSANGLEACQESEPGGVGFTGFRELEPKIETAAFTGTLPEEWESGNNFCPNGSKVGIVRIKTPLLSHELEGGVYLASPNANPFGSLVALYIVAQDKTDGVLVKLAGNVHLDEHSGRIVTTFDNTPQLPFEDLKVEFFGGATGPFSTPPVCGTYTTTTSLTPWSGNAAEQSSSSFAITSDPNGTPCPNPQPFSPSFTAGSTSIQAGTFSPFTLTMSREDGNQNLAGITVHMPVGLSGTLSSVALCGEPQASQGTCGPQSLIGHTVASVGLGPDPYTISGGQVFMTGPYKGAPFGLSIAEPTKAGPFDLGSGPCDCIVVRSKIEVDPRTSALTVVSDPLPTILQGIPLQLKHVNVTIDRPGFTFNPTNCSHLQLDATISSEQGANAPVSVPFQVANCATLPFKPSFSTSTQAKTSKADGASLRVKLAFAHSGEANVAKTDVQLPKQLPSRLTTLQKACTEAQFAANPAGCPAESDVGTAVAHTPILPVPLEGPAYLVSHGGKAFPELIIVLQGDGVTIELNGETLIKKGITYSKFESVPDVPVSNFELKLPEGPHSILSANGNLCAAKTALLMPTTITGQNGAVIKHSTKIAVTGCKPAITVARHSVKGGTATIAVSVPSAGELVASGKGLSRASKNAGGAGTVTVKLRLSNKEHAFLAHHPGRRLAARVKLVFTPTPKHGAKLSTSVTVLIG